jgi:hypothetical protein
VTPAIAALIIAWCMYHYPLGRETPLQPMDQI